jgi:nitric oxide reductase large subunit
MGPSEIEVFRISLAIASVIVAFGSVAGAVLGILFLQRRYQTRRREREATGAQDDDHPLALLMYAGSLFFWPAGLALALTVQQPKTARTCGVLLVLHLTVIALITCSALLLLAVIPDVWR